MIQHESRIVNVKCGAGVKVITPSNLYDCTLADGVFVGPFVEIQADVYVGARSKIQSHAFICSLVSIGSDCFIGHGVMFVNDTFSSGGPSGGDQSKWKKTSIGNKVSIGSNSTIMPVSICADVVIGCGSVVTKNISVPGVYAGNPARLLRRA